jgi:hypothetical protein
MVERIGARARLAESEAAIAAARRSASVDPDWLELIDEVRPNAAAEALRSRSQAAGGRTPGAASSQGRLVRRMVRPY